MLLLTSALPSDNVPAVPPSQAGCSGESQERLSIWGYFVFLQCSSRATALSLAMKFKCPPYLSSVARLIKTQRQKLGFNLKVRKAEKPLALTSTSVRIGDPASRNLRMRLCVRAVSSCFIILSSAGIKGVHHDHPVPMTTIVATEIRGVCRHGL